MSGSSNIVLVLVGLELLSWVFIILLVLDIALKYLLIQRYFLLGAIAALIWIPIGIPWILLIKIGLPPFHVWLITIAFYIRAWVFTFSITWHKFYPLFLLRETAGLKTKVNFGLVIILLSAVLMYNGNSLYPVLIFSSMSHRGWIVISLLSRKGFTRIYLLVYIAIFYALVISLDTIVDLQYCLLNQRTQRRLVWLLLRGLPPFTLFWLKVTAVCVVGVMRVLAGTLILVAAVLVLSVYYRVFNFRIVVNARGPLVWISPVVLLLSVASPIY